MSAAGISAASTLAASAAAVRRFQAERFRQTYQDLLATEPTRSAAEWAAW